VPSVLLIWLQSLVFGIARCQWRNSATEAESHSCLLLILILFVNCNWVDTWWQQYSTHLHTNNIQDNTVNNLTPGGSSTVHIYTQTIYRTTQLTTSVGRLSGIRTQSGQTKINDELGKNYCLTGKSAGRAPSLQVIPWHLPYN
jgi:hypothetical protein